MTQFYSTPQVAKLLGIKPDTLQKAIWQTRLNPPMKGPSGQYLWTKRDIDHASWVLLHKAYELAEESTDDQD
jgi:DNA-binding transcriptional MerR regulator